MFLRDVAIWQTVWLEARGRTYVTDARLRGESLTGFDRGGALVGDDPAGTVVEVQVVAGTCSAEQTALVTDDDTLVRKHIKLEDLRWLHHADRTGMLVWAEFRGRAASARRLP